MSNLAKLNPNHKPAFDGIKIATHLLSKLYREVQFKKAFLFGSAATSENTSDSDLDILIVVNNQEEVKLVYKTVNVGFFSPVAVDWIVKTKDDFEVQKNRGGVCLVAANLGKEILINELK